MVPTALIVLILVVAFFIGWYSYFAAIPKRLLLSRKFLMMFGPAAIMLFTLGLAVADVRIIWLSWVLLVIAIILVAAEVPDCRASMAAGRAREREIAERRARGG
jgi:hypothetical protein